MRWVGPESKSRERQVVGRQAPELGRWDRIKEKARRVLIGSALVVVGILALTHVDEISRFLAEANIHLRSSYQGNEQNLTPAQLHNLRSLQMEGDLVFPPAVVAVGLGTIAAGAVYAARKTN